MASNISKPPNKKRKVETKDEKIKRYEEIIQKLTHSHQIFHN